MNLLSRIIKNPITQKRLLRLKEMKRAYISLWIISILYVVSLGAELICNDIPLYVNYKDRSYFPVFKYYPDDTFTGSGKQTRPDYHTINNSPKFTQNIENTMVFPPIAFGPYASVNPDSIVVADVVTARFNPLPMIGTVNVRENYTIARSASFGPFIGKTDNEVRNLRLTDFFKIPESIRRAVAVRFSNESTSAFSAVTKSADGKATIISLATFRKRKKSPKTVRLTFREPVTKETPDAGQLYEITFDRELNSRSQSSAQRGPNLWSELSEGAQEKGEVQKKTAIMYFAFFLRFVLKKRRLAVPMPACSLALLCFNTQPQGCYI